MSPCRCSPEPATLSVVPCVFGVGRKQNMVHPPDGRNDLRESQDFQVMIVHGQFSLQATILKRQLASMLEALAGL